MFTSNKSRLKANFTTAYFACLAIAIFIQQFLPGYLRYSSIEAVSYRMNDGWCDPQKDGIGVHCFGDFYYPLTFVGNENPWSEIVNPYPPISLAIYKPFEWLSNVTAPRISLSLFLICLVISLLFPIFHMRFVTKEISTHSFVIMALVTLTCAPALMSLDRGNNQLFMIPPLYMFFRAILLNKEKQVLVFGLICVCIKPQFIVLGFLVFCSFGLKKTVKWLLTSGIIYAISFTLYLGSFPANILDWVQQALNFQEYAGRGILMPVNVSISSDIDIVLNVINQDVSRTFVKTIVYLLLLGFTFLLVKNLGKRSIIHNFVLVLFLPLLFTGTAFHYYLTILYVPFLYFFVSLLQEKKYGSIEAFTRIENSRPSLSNPLQGSTFLAFALLSFIPWGIPWSAIFPSLEGRGWDVIGINWLFSQYALLAFATVMIFQRRSTLQLKNHDKVD